jgi:hypothetical protein
VLQLELPNAELGGEGRARVEDRDEEGHEGEDPDQAVPRVSGRLGSPFRAAHAHGDGRGEAEGLGHGERREGEPGQAQEDRAEARIHVGGGPHDHDEVEGKKN